MIWDIISSVVFERWGNRSSSASHAFFPKSQRHRNSPARGRIQLRKRGLFQTLEARELLATIGNNLARGDQLYHYRIAIGAAAEFTQRFGGVEGAQQAIEDSIDQLNAIFESELSIHLDLVTGAETIFTDPATDPYTHGDITALAAENQATLNSIVGPENYDLGHVFGLRDTSQAGGAWIGTVGNDSTKARGASIMKNPVGDGWIRLLAHEIGHQFFGRHTFNGVNGSCNINSRSPLAAYEPGSGTTIMSYAQGCGSDNIGAKDNFYHAASFEDVQAFIGNLGPNDTSQAAPFEITATGNQIPLISAGSDYTIPSRTPFCPLGDRLRRR